MWGLLFVSVEIVGIYPVEASSTFVTACQFAPDANCAWVGYATVIFVYRTRVIVFWFPAADAETQTTWRKPAESIAMDGSVESRVTINGLSADLPEARMTWLPQVDPLGSELRMMITRSQMILAPVTCTSHLTWSTHGTGFTSLEETIPHCSAL